MAGLTVEEQRALVVLTQNPDLLNHPSFRDVFEQSSCQRAAPAQSGVRVPQYEGDDLEDVSEHDEIQLHSSSTGGGLDNPGAIVKPAQAQKTNEMFEILDKYDSNTVCVFLLQNKRGHADQLQQRYERRYGSSRTVTCIHSGRTTVSAEYLIGAYMNGNTNDIITLTNLAQLPKVLEFIRVLLHRGLADVHIFVDEADATFSAIMRVLSRLPEELQQHPGLKCTLVTATMPADPDNFGRPCIWE